MRLPDDPSVLVLLVATDAETWLPETLRGLRVQQHAPLKVLAIDNASTDGTPAILERAFGTGRVVALPERVGYGHALAAGLKVAVERGIDAHAFLLLHDDAALAPGAIEAMVEALRGDDVGIVGAKLLEWDDERALQDIGRTTDRYGRIVARVERSEIDQGQHDGIEEVLYATSAVLMTGRPVVEEVGLFDLRYSLLRDDLDLCWRARLAGFRTVVTSDASARHVSAIARDLRPGPTRRRIRYYGDRNMIATLVKNYSVPRLALALPVTILVSLLNIVLYTARGRRSAAVQVLEALRWNLVHLPSTIRNRRKAQRARRVRDGEITALMHHGATRVRAQIERAIETVVGEVEPPSEDAFEASPPRLIDRAREHPGAVALTLAAVVGLLGARPLLISGSIAGLDMPPFPSGAGAFFQEYASGWRGIGAGGAGPATPGLVLLGLLTTISFGSGWLAQRILLFGLPVLAAIGMYRASGALGLRPGGRRIATVGYAASPLILGAFGAGRLHDLILASAAPLLVLPLLRAAGIIERGTWRSTAAGTAGLAATASVAPWALPFVLGFGGVVAVIRRGPSAPVVLRRTGVMLGGALILLVPWAVELFRAGSPFGAGGPMPPVGMRELIALSPGEVRPVPIVLGFGLLLAALAGVATAGVDRRPMIVVVGGAGVLGMTAAWAIARGVPFIGPRPSLPLVAAALAVAVLAGTAFDTATASLGARTFGGAHLVAGVVGFLVVAQLGATAVWVAFGSRPGLVPAAELSLSSLAQEEDEFGDFRLIWIGGTRERPTVALTGPSGTTMRSYLHRRAGLGHDAATRAVSAILSGASDAGGRLLATMGVRYVIVRPEADATIRSAVADQPAFAFTQRLRPSLPEDVAEQETEPLSTGALVYRNESGMPIAAPVRSPGWVRASARPLAEVTAAEAQPSVATGLREVLPGSYAGPTPPDADVVLLAEDFSSSWRARVGDIDVAPELSFGWATRFVVATDGSPAQIWFAGQRWHRAGVLLQALLIAAFVIGRGQRIAREGSGS